MNDQKTEHTPGDWEFQQKNDAIGDRQEQDCFIFVKDENGKLIHIAETFQYQHEKYNQPDGTSLANAKLIASAPKLKRQRDALLKALRNVQLAIAHLRDD